VTTGSVKDLGINTDASKANTALDKLPELQAVLKQQQAMSAAAGTVVATSKQVAGDILANAVKTQAAAQQVLNDPNSTAEQKATATTTLADAQKTAADWGKGGIYSRALDAGTTILVGGLAGQAGTQIAANAVAPTVARTVGDIGSALAIEAHSNELKYNALAEQARLNNDPVAAADYTAKANAAATTAANWGDNGIFRVGLHTATQGLLGELADGRTGALQSAAGVVGGNLGQQLGEKLGNAQADKLGLPPGAARDAFVNAYQQTGAVVGGLVAGATAAGATGANVDALLAAARGADAARTVDEFNRQLHKFDYANAKRLAALSKGKYTEKQILDAMRWSGVSDGTNLLVEPGHAEAYAVNSDRQVLNLTNNEGWKPITSLVDISLAGVPGPQLVLKEVLPATPDAGLVNFIRDNSGGTSSPYVFSMPSSNSDTSGPRFPPAPQGTTRVTVNVDGGIYFPLRADCPQGCFDAIAHGIDDPGTRAYEKAQYEKLKRDAIMFGLGFINPLERGFGLVPGAGRSVAAGEATALARETGAVGAVRAGTAGEASAWGLVNKVGTATSADINAALQAKTNPLAGPVGAQSVAKNGAASQVINSTAGLDQATRNSILSIEKGMRPDPATYLSPSYSSELLAEFDGGATRFMTEGNLNKYGIGQRDGTSFVMPRQEANLLLDSTGGNPRALEKALGLPEYFLDTNKLVRIDIANPRELNLRIPSGNEAGANELWIPGGRLPNGNLEAVIDVVGVPTGRYQVTPLPTAHR
jgi:hypothetical protein